MTYYGVQLDSGNVTFLELDGLQTVGSACAVCGSSALPHQHIGSLLGAGTSVVACPGCRRRVIPRVPTPRQSIY